MADNDPIKKPLKAWLTEFYEDSGKISEIIRNLALAGIGIIWIFKNTDLSHNILPKELIIPLKFIVYGLIADLSQYLWRTLNIGLIYRLKENQHSKGDLTDAQISDVKMPTLIEVITWLLFLAKIVFVVTAYYYLYIFISSRV